MPEKRKGDSPDEKSTDKDDRKKSRRYNPRSKNTNLDLVRSRGRRPTKKYNPRAEMNTTPSPPVEYNQGTESVFSASDLAPVTPRKPRRGRPRKKEGERQTGTRRDEPRGRGRGPHPQQPLPSMSSEPSSSSHNQTGGSIYSGVERQSGISLFHGHHFEHNIFPTLSLNQPDSTVSNFENYFTLPASFGGMLQHDGAPMRNDGGEGGSGMHPVQLDVFELGSPYSPVSIDQRSASPSSQWSSDALSRMASITPDDGHFPPTPYFFNTLATPHWPTQSPDSQGTFMPGVDMQEPGMVSHPGLVIGPFSSLQPYPGVASSSNQIIGPSHGSSHQSSQSQNDQQIAHGIQNHIPYAGCSCPTCQHFHSWESR